MDGHYDPAADIAWIRFDGWDRDHVVVQETEHGLIERDRSTGRVLGLEYWHASARLPEELLDALPSPPSRQASVEAQRT